MVLKHSRCKTSFPLSFCSSVSAVMGAGWPLSRSPPAGCMSPRSQSRTVKNPHAPSFQLLNNTKQTVTYFQSREQAREKTRTGIMRGAGAGAGPSAEGRLQLLARVGRGEAWPARPGSMARHVSSRSPVRSGPIRSAACSLLKM